jgi:hypothetical protein
MPTFGPIGGRTIGCACERDATTYKPARNRRSSPGLRNAESEPISGFWPAATWGNPRGVLIPTKTHQPRRREPHQKKTPRPGCEPVDEAFSITTGVRPFSEGFRYGIAPVEFQVPSLPLDPEEQ